MINDHLARLCFTGAGPSAGHYTPHALTLRLRGQEQRVDHVVYLHEVHHAALNDMTAWGSVLHLFARLPEHNGEDFGRILDACRTTHESYATYGSVGIASARHGDLADVLAVYPEYVPLYRATSRAAGLVTGRNRRQLVVSALARVCMQTPALTMLAAHGIAGFRLAALRDLDRPDGRWAFLLRRSATVLADAAHRADAVVLSTLGSDALTSDSPDRDLYDSTLRSHDDAWELWETTAYEALRRVLAAAGAATFNLNGHIEPTAVALAALESEYGHLGLRAGYPDGELQNDALLASSVVQQVRHELAGGRRHPAIVFPTSDPAALTHLVQNTQPGRTGRALVVHVRPPSRLAQLYEWPQGAPPGDGPVAAVRLIVDDGAGGSLIAHAVLPTPESLTDLASAWQQPAPTLACVSASCLADPAWAARWFGPLSAALGELFVLVDVEPERFVPRWVREGRTVQAAGIDVDDTSGRRTALVLTADGGAVVWLVLADDVTVNLVLQYVAGQVGSQLEVRADWLESIRPAIVAVITHLLATESYTSFDAIGPAHAR